MVEFNDGKDRAAFRTIGEVSEALGIKPHVLRYWEQQFSLLKPMKRSGGRRLYRPNDIEMVEAINRLVNEEGYTLKGAEAVLRSSGASGMDRRREDRRVGDRRANAGDGQSRRADDTGAAEAPKPDYSDAIAKLKNLRGRLAKAIEA
ncbi:MerR family transcriptional regulator [uncultured Erythrobacter sp.]|uniref:MerR family transcriptional regulator n=1 Tax=uncultured Erythrobacter sp. TaxID=263913 RepID=UPI002622335F|nr:MerR family transcriptional regulator [uncultured Erythrobacter sp.]